MKRTLQVRALIILSIVTSSSAAMAQSGYPRSWEAGMEIGTYATANVRSGNVTTAILVVSWFGRGPAMELVLYHNSTDAAAVPPPTDGSGFSLGPGWRVSYGCKVVPQGAGPPYATVQAVEDDGTVNVFTLVGTKYSAPTGIYDRLVPIPGANNPTSWQLWRKDQSNLRFDGAGLLTSIYGPATSDAVANVLTVQRSAGRITSVTDAAGRALTFSYTGSLLTSITDVLSRTWTFQYTSNRLSSVTFPAVGDPPQNYMVSFGYDGSNRISTLTDRDGDAYSYVFVGGKITRVVDPAPYNTQQQRFSYVDLGGGQTRTDYTDRRNLLWKYTFSSLNECTVYQAPDLTQKQFGYDALHNPNSYTNELSKVWSATYDNRGNLLTTTDPLLHQTVRTWSPAPLNNS